MLGQVLGGGQLRVVDAAEGFPPCYGGRSVEKTAPGGSTWTFGCVATPPHLSPVSLWGVSTTEERHWGVCSRPGCPGSARRWPNCFQVGARRAEAEPPAPSPVAQAMDPPPGGLHTPGVQQLDVEELVLAPGQAPFFFFFIRGCADRRRGLL